jgi:hypothetical protein
MALSAIYFPATFTCQFNPPPTHESDRGCSIRVRKAFLSIPHKAHTDSCFAFLCPHPSWQTLDTTFYRNEHLYDLTWPIKDLSHHYVAVDKNGGSIGAWTFRRPG